MLMGILLFWEKDNIKKTHQGRTIVTHINRTLQYLIEQKLDKAIEKYEAISGTVTIMNPKTGAIIAMASFPSYDPRDYENYPKELYSNPVISKSFEPGSTFKVITMAAALDSHAVDLQTICPCQGPVVVSGHGISTWDGQFHPNSNIYDIIQHSDNVGMVHVVQQMEPETYVDYLNKFGLGKRTKIDLQEDSSPSLRNKWRPIDIATASFGQGIAVTPIQVLNAVNAIANGGYLLQPQVANKLIISDFEIEKAFNLSIDPEKIPYEINALKEGEIVDIQSEKHEQIIQTSTAKLMTDIMVNAVKYGEAKWTIPQGYDIAGKTGTAQIPVDGKYDEEKTIASFIGFAPAEDPVFSMLVTINEPQSSPWGSETAAPLWFDIAKDLFIHFHIAPSQ